MKKKFLLGSLMLVVACVGIMVFITDTKSSNVSIKSFEDKSKLREGVENYGEAVQENLPELNQSESDAGETNIIKREKIDQYLDAMKESGMVEDEEQFAAEIEEKMIQDKANELCAESEGFSVTDEEVDKAIEETKERIAGTEDYEMILAFCKGAGITEEEYWERAREAYRRNMLINKYYEAHKEQILQEVEDKNSLESIEKVKEEMEKITEENIEKFDVRVE